MAYFKAKYTYVKITIGRCLNEPEVETLEVIPGVKVKGRTITVPHHATTQFAILVSALNIDMINAELVNPQNESKTFEQWKNILLRQHEVQEWVMDGFLTPFQTDVLEKMGHLRSAHLWHPTGSGKTLSAILWSLIHVGSILVVTRAASRIQYGREFEKFSKLRAHVIRPANERKKKGVKSLEEYLEWCEDNEQRPVVVVGWESITSVVDELTNFAPDILIYDESHKGKNTKRYDAIVLDQHLDKPIDKRLQLYKQQEINARAKGGFIPDPNDPKASKYSNGSTDRVMLVPKQNITSVCSRLSMQADYILCTTATPIKDRVRDLWGQLDLAEPKSWGSFNVWAHRYCNAHPGYFGGLDTTGESNLEELEERLSRITHKIDYRDTHRHLPAKRRQSVYIAPEDQVKALGGWSRQIKAASKKGGTALLEVKLAQAASSKRKAIMDMVSDHLSSGHKVTIFSGRRKDVEDIGSMIKKLPIVKKSNGKIRVWAAHGENSSTERQQIVDDYMDSTNACCLVGTGNSFGESLNMQDTDAAFFVMLPYTPGELRQWEGRFCRLGQKRPVTIYYVIAESTVDEHVADILISKLPAVQKIAKDEELAEAQEVLAGLEDPEEIAESILSKL